MIAAFASPRPAAETTWGEGRREGHLLRPRHNVHTTFSCCHSDSSVQVVSLFKVHIDDVIAPDDAVQGDRIAIHVDSIKRRNFAGKRNEMIGDLLKIPELAGKQFE